MSCFGGRMNEYDRISLDRFDGKNLQSTVYFLSHLHEDHTVGLAESMLLKRFKSNKNIFLFCSEVTEILLLASEKYRHLGPHIKSIPINTPTTIQVPDPLFEEVEKVTVTLLPAFHCPGSVMCLIEGSEGTVLYTGDFRWEHFHLEHMHHLRTGESVKKIKSLYVDTTFCVPENLYIPSRQQCIEATYHLIREWTARSPHHVVYVSLRAQFGHEPLLNAVASRLNKKVHVSKKKLDVYNKIIEFDNSFTDDGSATQIHACGKQGTVEVDGEVIACHSNHDPDKILYILPTTMYFMQYQHLTLDKIVKKVTDHFFRVCYSFHSSYTEIKDLLAYLRPEKVFPNVKPPQDLSLAETQHKLNVMLKECKQTTERAIAAEEVEVRELGTLKNTRGRAAKRRRTKDSKSDAESLDFGTPSKVPLQTTPTKKLSLSQGSGTSGKKGRGRGQGQDETDSGTASQPAPTRRSSRRSAAAAADIDDTSQAAKKQKIERPVTPDLFLTPVKSSRSDVSELHSSYSGSQRSELELDLTQSSSLRSGDSFGDMTPEPEMSSWSVGSFLAAVSSSSLEDDGCVCVLDDVEQTDENMEEGLVVVPDPEPKLTTSTKGKKSPAKRNVKGKTTPSPKPVAERSIEETEAAIDEVDGSRRVSKTPTRGGRRGRRGRGRGLGVKDQLKEEKIADTNEEKTADASEEKVNVDNVNIDEKESNSSTVCKSKISTESSENVTASEESKSVGSAKEQVTGEIDESRSQSDDVKVASRSGAKRRTRSSKKAVPEVNKQKLKKDDVGDATICSQTSEVKTDKGENQEENQAVIDNRNAENTDGKVQVDTETSADVVESDRRKDLEELSPNKNNDTADSAVEENDDRIHTAVSSTSPHKENVDEMEEDVNTNEMKSSETVGKPKPSRECEMPLSLSDEVIILDGSDSSGDSGDEMPETNDSGSTESVEIVPKEIENKADCSSRNCDESKLSEEKTYSSELSDSLRTKDNPEVAAGIESESASIEVEVNVKSKEPVKRLKFSRSRSFDMLDELENNEEFVEMKKEVTPDPPDPEVYKTKWAFCFETDNDKQRDKEETGDQDYDKILCEGGDETETTAEKVMMEDLTVMSSGSDESKEVKTLSKDSKMISINVDKDTAKSKKSEKKMKTVVEDMDVIDLTGDDISVGPATSSASSTSVKFANVRHEEKDGKKLMRISFSKKENKTIKPKQKSDKADNIPETLTSSSLETKAPVQTAYKNKDFESQHKKENEKLADINKPELSEITDDKKLTEDIDEISNTSRNKSFGEGGSVEIISSGDTDMSDVISVTKLDIAVELSEEKSDKCHAEASTEKAKHESTAPKQDSGTSGEWLSSSRVPVSDVIVCSPDEKNREGDKVKTSVGETAEKEEGVRHEGRDGGSSSEDMIQIQQELKSNESVEDDSECEKSKTDKTAEKEASEEEFKVVKLSEKESSESVEDEDDSKREKSKTENTEEKEVSEEESKVVKLSVKEIEEKEELERQALGFMCETDSDKDSDESSAPPTPTAKDLYDEYIELSSGVSDIEMEENKKKLSDNSEENKDRNRRHGDRSRSSEGWLSSRSTRTRIDHVSESSDDDEILHHSKNSRELSERVRKKAVNTNRDFRGHSQNYRNRDSRGDSQSYRNRDSRVDSHNYRNRDLRGDSHNDQSSEITNDDMELCSEPMANEGSKFGGDACGGLFKKVQRPGSKQFRKRSRFEEPVSSNDTQSKFPSQSRRPVVVPSASEFLQQNFGQYAKQTGQYSDGKYGTASMHSQNAYGNVLKQYADMQKHFTDTYYGKYYKPAAYQANSNIKKDTGQENGSKSQFNNYGNWSNSGNVYGDHNNSKSKTIDGKQGQIPNWKQRQNSSNPFTTGQQKVSPVVMAAAQQQQQAYNMPTMAPSVNMAQLKANIFQITGLTVNNASTSTNTSQSSATQPAVNQALTAQAAVSQLPSVSQTPQSKPIETATGQGENLATLVTKLEVVTQLLETVASSQESQKSVERRERPREPDSRRYSEDYYETEHYRRGADERRLGRYDRWEEERWHPEDRRRPARYDERYEEYGERPPPPPMHDPYYDEWRRNHDPYDHDRFHDPHDRHHDPYDRHPDPFDRPHDLYDRHHDPYDRHPKPYDRNHDPYDRHGDPYDRRRDPYDWHHEPYGRYGDPYDRHDYPPDRDPDCPRPPAMRGRRYDHFRPPRIDGDPAAAHQPQYRGPNRRGHPPTVMDREPMAVAKEQVPTQQQKMKPTRTQLLLQRYKEKQVVKPVKAVMLSRSGKVMSVTEQGPGTVVYQQQQQQHKQQQQEEETRSEETRTDSSLPVYLTGISLNKPGRQATNPPPQKTPSLLDLPPQKKPPLLNQPPQKIPPLLDTPLGKPS